MLWTDERLGKLWDTETLVLLCYCVPVFSRVSTQAQCLFRVCTLSPTL
jgi:hypothetical protein